MRIALGQIDPKIGDFRGTLAKLRDLHARARGCELLVLPELAATGYPPRDLLGRRDFLAAEEAFLAEAAALSAEDPALLIGCTRPRSGGSRGKPLLNAAVLFERGRRVGQAAKSLLPTYDVFDEARYFEPAAARAPLPFRGLVLGVTICEDIWTEEPYAPPGGYPIDPAAELAAAGCDLLINISASPFQLGRPAYRGELLARTARRLGLPLLFANQVGGQDELVFDGCSSAYAAGGELRARAHSFAEDLLVVELGADGGPRPGRIEGIPACEEEEACRALELGLADYVEKCGFSRVVIGLSGGIDSALTAALAVRALGPERVEGIAMPSPYSSEGSLRDARALAESLGIVLHEIPIGGIFAAYLEALERALGDRPAGVTEENIQARIRGDLVMAFSNLSGALVLTTGNKSELAVGYCTLYGDMSGGLALISDVPKTLVYRLARWLNRGRELIPRASIEKPPSAELRPGQTDQDSLPPYELLDRVLEAYVEEGRSVAEIEALGLPRDVVRAVTEMIDRNEYKRRQAAPGIRITSKAFGMGRRFPVAADYSALRGAAPFPPRAER